jgi:hypothetical protein
MNKDPLPINDPPREMKICYCCKILKIKEDFYKKPSKKNADGVMSVCKKCRVSQAQKHYLLNKEKIRESQKKWRTTHRETQNAKRKALYFKNREIELEQRKKYYKIPGVFARRKATTYGITVSQFQKLRSEKFCGICRKPFCTYVPSIDHCHSTKKVRGALCRECNSGLGFFADDPLALLRAAHYVAHEGDLSKFEEP